jgi:hypothetical protein
MRLLNYLSVLGLTAASLWIPTAVNAQSSAVDTCESALLGGEERLNDVRGVTVTFLGTRDLTEQYRNPPADRPVEILIGMSGTDIRGRSADEPVYNVLSSPVMMADIAANIFAGCAATGMVTFGLDGTGLTYSVGWTPDGPLAFECAPDDKFEAYDWGEMYCD